MPQRILVADDSKTIRTLVQRAVGNAGYQVDVAEDGLEAVERLSQSCPDLLILDIEMPALDGYAVCQRLREMGSPWDTLPIILLTSVQAQAVRTLGEQLGAYIPKPVCTTTLLKAVGEYLGPGQAFDPVDPEHSHAAPSDATHEEALR